SDRDWSSDVCSSDLFQEPENNIVRGAYIALAAGQRGGESDVGAPDDVVLGLLEDERRPAASDQRPEHPRPRIRRAEPLTEHARVQAPTRAKLCDLLEDLPPRGEIERDPRREVVDG